MNIDTIDLIRDIHFVPYYVYLGGEPVYMDSSITELMELAKINSRLSRWYDEEIKENATRWIMEIINNPPPFVEASKTMSFHHAIDNRLYFLTKYIYQKSHELM